MIEKKIIGIDLEIGSSPNSSIAALYAVYAYDGKINKGTNLRNVRFNELNKMIEEFQADFVVSDNILEIVGNKQYITRFLATLPTSTKFVQITYDENGYQQNLPTLAKQAGLDLYGKLNPEKTSELCVFLLLKGVGKILSSNGESMSVHQYLEKIHQQETTIEKTKKKEISLLNDAELSQFPSLVSKFSPHSKFITFVGEGKEAIVGLFTDLDDNYQVIKCFRKYSPVVNALKSKVYHHHEWDYAIKLAKSEEEYLRIANIVNIPSPKVISQSGPFVVMEAITYENGEEIKIAPTLAQINLRHLNLDPIDILYQALDLLLLLFSEAKLVHNDFSAQNLLLKHDQLLVIDFSQAEMINFKTYIDTPKRIRIDTALFKVKKDITNITTYFTKKYRLRMETAQIYKEFVNTVPQKLLDQCEENLIT